MNYDLSDLAKWEPALGQNKQLPEMGIYRVIKFDHSSKEFLLHVYYTKERKTYVGELGLPGDWPPEYNLEVTASTLSGVLKHLGDLVQRVLMGRRGFAQ